MPKPDVESFSVDGPLLIRPKRFSDDRGTFCETYNAADFAGIGVTTNFIQDNQSLSRDAGTIRGLHFQIQPFAQAKLVRVLCGAIYDAAVDIRTGSPTYGKSIAVRLSADTGDQLYVPAGFAHGFCTLEPDTEVLYKVDAPYSREHERGLNWLDPALGIEWPVSGEAAIIIERDRQFPLLRDLLLYFN